MNLDELEFTALEYKTHSARGGDLERYKAASSDFKRSMKPDLILALVRVAKAAQTLLPLLDLVCDEECELETALRDLSRAPNT